MGGDWRLPTVLAAFAIVRERERGTLEQLMVTPVSPLAVVLGKLLPYLGLASSNCSWCSR